MSTAAIGAPYPAHWQRRLDRARERIAGAPRHLTSGRITRATGLVLEAVGLQVPVGSACRVELHAGTQIAGAAYAEAEVVGFAGDRLFLMPLARLEGLSPGARVFPVAPGERRVSRRFPLGETLLGRVVDGNGQPLDGGPALHDAEHDTLTATPVNPLERAPIDTQIDVGVRAINALLSVGRGQRLGLFAGPGVGKSMLLGMMARHTEADVIVVGLIGERGREVKDFIDNILGDAGRRRAVVVAAPADASPLQRLQGAAYATRIAEHFRDQGRSVLLLMDSLTRYAMAQREIALAIGEPPATKGYPPSVFARLPALVERAGNGDRGRGSITAFYTVLTEGDELQDPIGEAARAVLDGHIVLSRHLADAGHYPAIDIEASISRAMTGLVGPAHQRRSRRFKRYFSLYQRNRDLISVGAYAAGHDPALDQAVQIYPRLEEFLRQEPGERTSIEDAHEALSELIGEAT